MQEIQNECSISLISCIFILGEHSNKQFDAYVKRLIDVFYQLYSPIQNNIEHHCFYFHFCPTSFHLFHRSSKYFESQSFFAQLNPLRYFFRSKRT